MTRFSGKGNRFNASDKDIDTRWKMTAKQSTNSQASDSEEPLQDADGNEKRMGMESSKTTYRSSTPDHRKDHFVIKIPHWLCGLGTLISVLVGILACFVVAVSWTRKPDIGQWMLEVEDRAGRGGVDLFKSYDLNRDGYLSIFEFEPLIPHLKNLSSAGENGMPMEKYLDYSPEEGEEVLTVYTNFTPLQLETMTKEDILTMEITGKDSLNGLKTWKEPIRKHTVFGASEFRSLLPEELTSLAVGKPYHVLPYRTMATDQGLGGTYSSSRFYPPVPKGKERLLFRLLGMMHHRPFVSMRFPPRGTVACVKAFSDRHVHVVFRMHAEFQLNEPPLRPFWFTPAQFVGDLVMTRDGTHVDYFRMAVPSHRKLNVDMEWLTEVEEGEDSMEVDIGYMPLMEWTVKGASLLPASTQDSSTVAEAELPPLLSPDHIEWSLEMSREEALRMIEIEFYPFKTVTYHNLTQGLQLSREQNKPLHAIFLWGALDDQSC